jgi:hypothetical protein
MKSSIQLLFLLLLGGNQMLLTMESSMDLCNSMEIEKEEEALKAWQDWCKVIVHIPVGKPRPRFVPDPTPEQLEEGKAFADKLERENAPARLEAERKEKAAQLIFERSNRKTSRILLHSQLLRSRLATQQLPNTPFNSNSFGSFERKK